MGPCERIRQETGGPRECDPMMRAGQGTGSPRE